MVLEFARCSYLSLIKIASFLVASKIRSPKSQPESTPQMIPAKIAILFSHQSFIEFTIKKNIREIIVLPKIEMDRNKVLKPLLTDLCCTPTKTEADRIPPVARKNRIRKKMITRAVPTISAKRKNKAPINRSHTKKSSSFRKESII